MRRKILTVVLKSLWKSVRHRANRVRNTEDHAVCTMMKHSARDLDHEPCSLFVFQIFIFTRWDARLGIGAPRKDQNLSRKSFQYHLGRTHKFYADGLFYLGDVVIFAVGLPSFGDHLDQQFPWRKNRAHGTRRIGSSSDSSRSSCPCLICALPRTSRRRWRYRPASFPRPRLRRSSGANPARWRHPSLSRRPLCPARARPPRNTAAKREKIKVICFDNVGFHISQSHPERAIETARASHSCPFGVNRASRMSLHSLPRRLSETPGLN